MRLIEVLSDTEAKRFSKPPLFTPEERKKYFKIDTTIRPLMDKVKYNENKIGLLIQYGYFKVSGKFFTTKSFRAPDIHIVTKMLGVKVANNFLEKYSDRTRQKHRLQILELCGYMEFSRAVDIFEEAVTDMVNTQMHPRKLFYVLIEQLRQKKIELPSYDRVARIITDKFHAFEKKVTQTILHAITPAQQEALDQLIKTEGESYERALLTRLKSITQSMQPGRIKQGMRNFLIIKKLHQELKPVIEQLNLSPEATKYYAQWVNKAKITQVAEIADFQKRNLYLVAFIDHWYRLWQDTFIDILLKAVQQQINKAAKEVDILVKTRAPIKNKLAESVLFGFNNINEKLNEIRGIIHHESFSNDEKIHKLHNILPTQEEEIFSNRAIDDAKNLFDQIAIEKNMGDQFDVLGKLSRKLQNRVADIVKHLDFELDNNAQDLRDAISYYQTTKNITISAPYGFLEDHEYQAIYRDDKFNVSLYKALLFCKIANAVKSGQISLVSSYRFLSIDSYLLDESYWKEHKEKLIEKLGLAEFSDINQLLMRLREVLDKQFIDVNESIIKGINKFVTIQTDGRFSLHTPAVPKPDYDSIVSIIGKGKYIPILQMMTEINALTNFTTCFKHHKITGSKSKPENEIFYAGIFGLGSNIGLHKLANTAIGINYNTLSHTVNWYFSLDNLHAVNQKITELMSKLWLPEKFKRERNLLHTSSDGKKQCVSAESLNANHSFKYFGHEKGSSVYRFIDERGILFYTTVFSSAERDAMYVLDGLLHNDAITSNIHSTDTHGYTEMVFAISHLISVTFAPRIKDLASQNLVSFSRMRGELEAQGYPIKPTYYVNENRIKRHWDNILRLIATIKLREHRASTILKRLGEYSNQHPLEEALKEFGRIIKSIFILKYIDDVEWRQAIEKQLNKGELANKFSAAVSFADQNILESLQEKQEITVMCKTIIQNIIILWNYIELTKIIMRAASDERERLLEHITNASILTWQHVNLHGTYDFSNLLSSNDSEYTLDEVLNFKAA